jgi:hypothetical protein
LKRLDNGLSFVLSERFELSAHKQKGSRCIHHKPRGFALRLHKHPELLSRFSEILDVVEQVDGNCRTAEQRKPTRWSLSVNWRAGSSTTNTRLSAEKRRESQSALSLDGSSRIVAESLRQHQRIFRLPADPEFLPGLEGGAVAVAIGKGGRERDSGVGRDEDMTFAAVVSEGCYPP